MLGKIKYEELSRELSEAMTAEELVQWATDRIPAQNLVVTTGFGMEGCALIDMFAKRTRELQVTYLDTGVLFPETYDLRDRLARRYQGVHFVNRGTSLSMEDQAILYGDKLWRRNPDLCCHLRKVEPMAAALATAHAWVTAVTRSQSDTRSTTPVVSFDDRYEVLKLAPLASWDRARVWEYVQANDVPYNPLHLQGYPSIGCTHCTRSVAGSGVTEYTRAGRWAGLGKTECGLHSASPAKDGLASEDPAPAAVRRRLHR